MDALYYPFHLCHERTLRHLLTEYERVHFRDYMAIQLTPLVGTTAYPDRMGDYYQEDLEADRIVQGHNVSGVLSPEVMASVNRDFEDPTWRALFHEALTSDHRFQRGLFDVPLETQAKGSTNASSGPWHALMGPEWEKRSYQVESVQALTKSPITPEEEPNYDYGFALIKTSAALVYTIRLCHQHNLVAVTDSQTHHQLLERTRQREHLDFPNHCVQREGY